MAIDPASAVSAAASLNPARPFANPPQSRPVTAQLFHQNHHSHPHHHHHQQPQPPLYTAQPLPVRVPIPPYNPAGGQLAKPSAAHDGASYPVASTGRGFVPHKAFRPLPAADQTVTVANPGGGSAGFPPRSPSNFHAAQHVARSIQHHQAQHYHPHHVAPVKGLPVSLQPKVVPSSSVTECNGYKDNNIREKSRDDMLAVVRDRKVRITEGATLFALCRSWLRNGLPEENQPQYGDAARSLPKPLPISVATGNLKEEAEEKEDTNDAGEEEEEMVEHLSAEDLFRGHVKRAKKVRARLREVRLKQIARYKLRLALLLPPLVEQFRNDSAAAGT